MKKTKQISEMQLLMTPPSDMDHLHAWIQRYTGLDFPRQTISRFSTSNPFEFIWLVYRAIMDGKAESFLSIAGRDSLKTLSLSVIDLLAFLMDERDAVHCAMTSQQGSRARAYLENFLHSVPLLKSAIVKQNTRELRLEINNKKVGIEILAATPKAVQGAHCSFLSWDELASSMEPANLRAYKDSHGILGSSHKQKPGIVVKISSRQTGHSVVEEELRDAARTGIKVLRWTTIDTMERCPDDRSGTTPTPLWVNPLKGEVYTEVEFDQIDEGKKTSFQKTEDTFDGCRSCAIAAFCCGDSKKQQSTSKLLRTVDDVVNKIRLAGSWDWGVAQIMSMKPSSEGLVYFEFDRHLHVPGWNKMWEALTGMASPAEITRDQFVSELKKRGGTFYAGIDWGWSAPSTCVVVGIDRTEKVYVLEAVGKTYTSDPDFISFIRNTIHRKYDIQMYCPDIANGSGNALIRQAGLPTTSDIDKSKSLGINLVKGLLRVPGTNGVSRIFFAPDLQSTVSGIPGILEEFELYHKKTDAAGRILDDSDPEGADHYLDSMRYLVYWLFGRSRMRMASEYTATNAATRPMSNIPSLEEIARANGIQFIDNREKTPEETVEDGPRGPVFTWT